METKQIESISVKQYFQLVKFAEHSQTFLPFPETTFIKLIRVAGDYCFTSIVLGDNTVAEACLRKDIYSFESKYYPGGVNLKKKQLTTEQHSELFSFFSPRFKNLDYSPIQKVVFIKICRACFRFVSNSEKLDVFLSELSYVSNLLKN